MLLVTVRPLVRLICHWHGCRRCEHYMVRVRHSLVSPPAYTLSSPVNVCEQQFHCALALPFKAGNCKSTCLMLMYHHYLLHFARGWKAGSQVRDEAEMSHTYSSIGWAWSRKGLATMHRPFPAAARDTRFNTRSQAAGNPLAVLQTGKRGVPHELKRESVSRV